MKTRLRLAVLSVPVAVLCLSCTGKKTPGKRQPGPRDPPADADALCKAVRQRNIQCRAELIREVEATLRRHGRLDPAVRTKLTEEQRQVHAFTVKTWIKLSRQSLMRAMLTDKSFADACSARIHLDGGDRYKSGLADCYRTPNCGEYRKCLRERGFFKPMVEMIRRTRPRPPAEPGKKPGGGAVGKTSGSVAAPGLQAKDKIKEQKPNQQR